MATSHHELGEQPIYPDPIEERESYALSIDDVNEFFYGYRYVDLTQDGDEDEVWDMVPLTLDDVMYPLLDDRMGQTYDHSLLGGNLYISLDTHVKKIPGTHVLLRVVVGWGIEGQQDLVPDIMVMMHVCNLPKTNIGIFDRAKYGGTPLLAIEMTSKNTRFVDVNQDTPRYSKYREYERIGVHYFVIIDVSRQPMHAPPAFWGHQLVGKTYRPLQPDQHGRLWLPQLGVALGTHGNTLAWFDANGKRLLSFEEEEARANEAEARADQEAAAHRKEKVRADKAEEELRQLKARLGMLEEENG